MLGCAALIPTYQCYRFKCYVPLGDAMIRAIRRVTKQPICRLILSHYHADHFYDAQSFKAIGAEIGAGKKGRDYLESDLAQQRLRERRRDLAPDVDANTRLVPADRWLAFRGGHHLSAR